MSAIPFPYKGLGMSIEDRQRMMTYLKNHTMLKDTKCRVNFRYACSSSELRRIYHLNFDSGRWSSNPLIYISTDDDYQNGDILTDFYTEEQRLSGHVHGHESPISFWENNYEVIRGNVISRGLEVTPSTLRESVYQLSRECTQFKATVTKAVIQQFDARRILDPCAGWGDRLIGAIAADVDRYLGFDPNTRLCEGHSKIIQEFGDSSKHTVVYEPFQHAVISPEETFDLIFTSPPYGRFEIYTNDATQSVSEYPSNKEWLTKFLFASLHKAWQHLEDGGHMVIHISDTTVSRCCLDIFLFVSCYLLNSCYLGAIGSRNLNKRAMRPMWVWKKDSTSTSENYRRKLSKNYMTKDCELGLIIRQNMPEDKYPLLV